MFSIFIAYRSFHLGQHLPSVCNRTYVLFDIFSSSLFVMCQVMVFQYCSEIMLPCRCSLQFHVLGLSGSGDRLTSRSDTLTFSILFNSAKSRASHPTIELRSVVEFEFATQQSLRPPDLLLSARFKTRNQKPTFGAA